MLGFLKERNGRETASNAGRRVAGENRRREFWARRQSGKSAKTRFAWTMTLFPQRPNRFSFALAKGPLLDAASRSRCRGSQSGFTAGWQSLLPQEKVPEGRMRSLFAVRSRYCASRSEAAASPPPKGNFTSHVFCNAENGTIRYTKEVVRRWHWQEGLRCCERIKKGTIWI